MNGGITELDYATFSQAIEGMGREELKTVKAKLINKKEDIELQLDAFDLHGPEGVRDGQWFLSARTKRSFIIRMMSLVDSKFAATNKEGGWLMWVFPWTEGEGGAGEWIATKIHPAQWLVERLVEEDGTTPEISFFIAVTLEQWQKIPASIEGIEV